MAINLKKDWKRIIAIVLLSAALLGSAFSIGYISVVEASAFSKEEAAPEVTECVPVSTFAGIVTARCEDVDRGFIFYKNDRGFMLPDTE